MGDALLGACVGASVGAVIIAPVLWVLWRERVAQRAAEAHARAVEARYQAADARRREGEGYPPAVQDAMANAPNLFAEARATQRFLERCARRAEEERVRRARAADAPDTDAGPAPMDAAAATDRAPRGWPEHEGEA